ncbi:MAG: 2Fe-2S iron-sulfur cluster-binding protein [Candidatus Lernaella stagnicola]|nr:2Fe-2S iron-sulfur cluster-binding protein [Candidatus Lernaella stagnicola]
MAELIKVTVNGKEIEVPYDTQLLQACRQAGADVPTLCHNENLKPYGVCRICSVEINEGRKTRIVPSCVYTVRKPVTVETDTPRIRKHRAMLLNLLLARCPGEKVVQDLAAEFGVTEPHPRFEKRNDDCILCGMCVQTCRDIVGVAAIAFEGRGTTRRVTPPFDKENDVCIACGACAYVCPTQCIDFHDEAGTRHLDRWHRETELLVCDKCGRYWLPDAFAHVFHKRMGIDPASLTTCPNCR